MFCIALKHAIKIRATADKPEPGLKGGRESHEIMIGLLMGIFVCWLRKEYLPVLIFEEKYLTTVNDI